MTRWQATRRHKALSALVALTLWACQRTPAPEPADAPPPKRASEPATLCPGPLPDSVYDTPETAYAAYAEAVNQGRYCEAIASFEEASRPRIALANLKAIAVLAGTANPKQREYAAALKQLCQRRELECANDAWLARVVPVLASGGAARAELTSIAARAQQAPTVLYAELMQLLQSVDAAAMARLEPTLTNVAIHGDSANGTAQRTGGKSAQILFVHGPRGWKLLMPG